MKEENEQYYNCYGDKVKFRRVLGGWVSRLDGTDFEEFIGGLDEEDVINDELWEVEDVNTGVTYDVYESELTLWED